MNREKNKNIAKDTLNVLKQGCYYNLKGEKIILKEQQKYAEDNTKVISPKESDELINNNTLPETQSLTKYTVINDTTLNAVRNLVNIGLRNIMCLNFASAKNPGGGFLNGSQAQEESIARASGLYPCLLKCDEYYLSNSKLKSCFYTDYMIYSPDVPVFKNEQGKYLDEFLNISFITAPAVNTNVVSQREPHRIDEIGLVMKRRIEKVLMISYANNHRNLVLGAWGCGVFGNSPKEISGYFKEIIDTKFKNVFENIVFAIYSKDEKFIKPFYENFLKSD